MPQKRVPKVCIECNCSGKEHGITYNKYFQVLLCNNCRTENDRYQLISKTKIKTIYGLKDNEIEKLIPFSGKKTSSYGPATYYTTKQVLDYICYEKYHVDTVEEALYMLNMEQKYKIDKRKRRQIDMKEFQEKNKEKRKEELVDALHKAGLTLRSDSVLCQKYIDGYDKSITLESVVRRMCEMRYLYDYCHMDECRDIVYEKHNELLDAGYFPDASVSEEAEDMALEKYSNGEYPLLFFPWQIKPAQICV